MSIEVLDVEWTKMGNLPWDLCVHLKRGTRFPEGRRGLWGGWFGALLSSCLWLHKLVELELGLSISQLLGVL